MKFEFFRQKLENVVNKKLHSILLPFLIFLKNLKTSKHWLILQYFFYQSRTIIFNLYKKTKIIFNTNENILKKIFQSFYQMNKLKIVLKNAQTLQQCVGLISNFKLLKLYYHTKWMKNSKLFSLKIFDCHSRNDLVKEFLNCKIQNFFHETNFFWIINLDTKLVFIIQYCKHYS